ncbi:response regulator transcription factor, partial [Desulfamplus magnetovallimortis]|uniref:response regulator transcription factor n=1 Tax=Desulfamplus magnetovallimortis TaxID=1246637 RepID=UPI001C965565
MINLTDLKILTILLVEDEHELRRETAAFLELYCGQVIQASNGREALAIIGTHKSDVQEKPQAQGQNQNKQNQNQR